MKFAIIENNKVVNVIVAEKEFAEQIGAIYCDGIPVGIETDFINNQFVVVDPDGFKTYYDIPDISEPEPEPILPDPNEFILGLMEGYYE